MQTSKEHIEKLISDEEFLNTNFSFIDIELANFVKEKLNENSPYLYLAVLFLSKYQKDANPCICLKTIAKKYENLCSHDWVENLKKIKIIGDIFDEDKTFILNNEKLYFQKNFAYQKKIINFIKTKIKETPKFNEKSLKETLYELFHSEFTEQKLAAFLCVISNFCIISGGPGTGKTTIIKKILLMLGKALKNENLKIALLAPTGKAASRISENINPIENQDITISTIHRILKTKHNSNHFFYNSKNPLLYDIIVVDELSMCDIPLLSKLFDAIGRGCKVVLLGDKNQLPSIYTGSFLKDICEIAEKEENFSSKFCNLVKKYLNKEFDNFEEKDFCLKDCTVFLKTNYRFKEDSAIYKISNLINMNKGAQALELLKNSSFDDFYYETIKSNNFYDNLRKKILDNYPKYIKATFTDIDEAFRLIYEFKILSSFNEGFLGTNWLNKFVELLLSQEAIIPENKFKDEYYYHGKPIIVSKNNYKLGIFNGDIGIVVKENEGFKVLFQDINKEIKKIDLFAIPENNTVYAMTVHKSQGSEFSNILLILHSQKNSSNLSKELLYTGITRAKKKLYLASDDSSFLEASSKMTKRFSGFKEAFEMLKV